MFSLAFPQCSCIYSPDANAIDNFQISNTQIVPVSDLTISEVVGSSASPTNIVYFDHYSPNVMAESNRDIINMEKVSISDISVLNYLSYYYYLKKASIVPDEPMKELLSVCIKEY